MTFFVFFLLYSIKTPWIGKSATSFENKVISVKYSFILPVNRYFLFWERNSNFSYFLISKRYPRVVLEVRNLVE